MSRDDRIRTLPDAPFRVVGTGMASPTFLCMGCNKPRLSSGSRGVGIRRRCDRCVAAREQGQACRR